MNEDLVIKSGTQRLQVTNSLIRLLEAQRVFEIGQGSTPPPAVGGDTLQAAMGVRPDCCHWLPGLVPKFCPRPPLCLLRGCPSWHSDSASPRPPTPAGPPACVCSRPSELPRCLRCLRLCSGPHLHEQPPRVMASWTILYISSLYIKIIYNFSIV